MTLNWAQMPALPRVEIVSDFHCVTRWSTFDNRWEGVPIREILRGYSHSTNLRCLTS